MSRTSVLRIVEFLYPSAVVRLHVSKLAQDAAARGALARLGVWPPREVAQPVDSAASSAFKHGRERLESDHGWSPDYVEPSIVLLARIGESAAKRVVRPLKEKIRNGIEDSILIDRSLL